MSGRITVTIKRSQKRKIGSHQNTCKYQIKNSGGIKRGEFGCTEGHLGYHLVRYHSYRVAEVLRGGKAKMRGIVTDRGREGQPVEKFETIWKKKNTL